MFCKKCGKQIEDNSKFCPYCGESYVKTVTPDVSTNDNQAQVNVQQVMPNVNNNFNQAQMYVQQKPKKSVEFVEWIKKLFSLDAVDYVNTVSKDESNTGFILLGIEAAVFALLRTIILTHTLQGIQFNAYYFSYGLFDTILFFIGHLFLHIILTAIAVGILIGSVYLITYILKKNVKIQTIAAIVSYSIFYFVCYSVIYCVLYYISNIIKFVRLSVLFDVGFEMPIMIACGYLLLLGTNKLCDDDKKVFFIFVGLLVAFFLITYYIQYGLVNIFNLSSFSFLRGWFY